MKHRIVSLAVGIIISMVSIAAVLIIAEYSVRIKDRFFAEKQTWHSDDDGTSRLRGYSLDKPQGTYRILILGDSVSYGQGVRWDKTFSKQLEILLNGESNKRRYEVINTGLCGIDTTQELSILQNKGPDPQLRHELIMEGYQGLAYNPDLIILQYTFENDAMTPQELDPNLKSKRFGPNGEIRRQNYGEYALPLPESIDKWLTVSSKFYIFFLVKYHGFLSTLGLRDEAAKIKAMYKPDAIGWQRTQYALSMIAAIALSRNIPVVMMIHATSNDTGELITERNMVSQFARSRGMDVIDLADAVKWPKENFAVSQTDGHPNAKAHRIMAEVLYKDLRDRSLTTPDN